MRPSDRSSPSGWHPRWRRPSAPAALPRWRLRSETSVQPSRPLDCGECRGSWPLCYQSLFLDIMGLVAIVGLAMTMLRRFGGPDARHDRLYRAPADPRSVLDDWWILGGFEVILITGFVMEGARIVATADPWGAWS